MTVRLLCWNIAHRTSAWVRVVELAEEHRVDVALLQEAGRPQELPAGVKTFPERDADATWHTWDRPDSKGRRWCSALAWFPWTDLVVTGVRHDPIWKASWDTPPITHPGQFAVGTIRDEAGHELTVVSLYGAWEYRPDRSSEGFAEATLHRAISDLTPVLLRRTPLVIAGDLNILYGYPAAADAMVPRYQTVFDRLAAYGVEVVGPFRAATELLDGCRCEDVGCRHVSTRPDGSGVPWQLDWVLSNQAQESIKAVALPIEPEVSDHAPIVIDVRIG